MSVLTMLVFARSVLTEFVSVSFLGFFYGAVCVRSVLTISVFVWSVLTVSVCVRSEAHLHFLCALGV